MVSSHSYFDCQIELVQKLALKIVSGERNTGYPIHLYPSSKFLRYRGDDLNCQCVSCTKFQDQSVFPEGLIVRKPPSSYTTRSSRRHLLVQPFVKTSSHLNSFIPHSVSLWNSLPSHCSTLSLRLSHSYLLVIFFLIGFTLN